MSKLVLGKGLSALIPGEDSTKLDERFGSSGCVPYEVSVPNLMKCPHR